MSGRRFDPDHSYQQNIQNLATKMALLLSHDGIIIAEKIVDGVPVNPVNSPLDGVEHIHRSHEEITLWRNRPFITHVGNVWQVRCLDGKTSDRISNCELADNEADAVWAAWLTE